MPEVEIRVVGSLLEMELRDADALGKFVFDSQQATRLLSMLAMSLSALPRSETPMHEAVPVLRSVGPPFQIGLAKEGVVLAIKPEPLPHFEFVFDHRAVSKLIEDLRRASLIPLGGMSSAH